MRVTRKVFPVAQPEYDSLPKARLRPANCSVEQYDNQPEKEGHWRSASPAEANDH
jgi:hypothetical protein